MLLALCYKHSAISTVFYLICAYTSKKLAQPRRKNSTDASAPSARFSISEKEGWFLSSSAAKPASEIEKVHNYSILVISILQEIEKVQCSVYLVHGCSKGRHGYCTQSSSNQLRQMNEHLNLGFCNIYHKDQSLNITNTNAKGNKISGPNSEWGLSLQVRVVGGWLGD